MGAIGVEEALAVVGLMLVGVAAFAISGWWGLLGFVGGLMLAGALVLAMLRGNQQGRR